MVEELGNPEIEISAQSSVPIYYDFPYDLKVPIAQKYCGQRTLWFKCRFSHHGPKLDQAVDKEFQAFRWVNPRKAPTITVWWKQEAYKKGMPLLGFSLSGSA